MSKRIVLGDVENGELANTDAEWSIDESGQLVLDIPESGAYDMSGVDLKGLQSFSTERVNSNYHYAAAYDGQDLDARLDNALSSAQGGDTVMLEPGNHGARTISTSLRIIGTGGSIGSMSRINDSWTITQRCRIDNISLVSKSEVELKLQSDQTVVKSVDGGGSSVISVEADGVIISHVTNGNVIFEQGTADGLVDTSTLVSVTDNGSNTIGDIS